LLSLVEYLKTNNDYWVVFTKPRLITIVSAILIVVVLVIVGAVTKAQTSQSYVQVILNLLNGQQYFGVPHVYQGDYNGTPTNSWPVYYGPSTASQYWSQGGISSDQPVLELTPYLGIPAYVLNKPGTAGSVFWDETYSGGSLTVTLLGTFSNGQPPGQFADGFEIYLFLKPTMWSVSPQYNYSVSYISTSKLRGIKVYIGGIIPQSSTPCLIVQWDPFLEPVYHVSGQWNVVILSNTNGTNPSVVAGWIGIGTGFIYPNPGDRINVTVTYNPSTNTLSGVVTDLNTGQSVSFILSLSGYFTPPSSSNYVFGIGATTGWGYANWALLYVAMTQQPTTLPTPPALPQNYQVILKLLSGQQYFGVPHVYQGDNDGSPTNSWPVYLGPNNASQYWSHAGINSNQPVLELVPHS